jgi:hypothetical protein
MKNIFLLLILAFDVSKTSAQKNEISKTIADNGVWDYLDLHCYKCHLVGNHS